MSRTLIQATWSDVPHLTDKAKTDLRESIPPHMRDARTKGVPMLGAGQIYPVDEASLVVDPFDLPDWWPRAYALDVGWNRTAALWGAWDREADTVYLYSEYYAAQQPPAVHASAIRARGEWIWGAIDPASAGANQKDGSTLIQEYRGLGLSLVEADNTVEAGIFACYQRMTRGGLKVFRTLPNWLAEFRIYRRVERQTELGQKVSIVKENDHLMDAMRYLIMTGMQHARTAPEEDDAVDRTLANYGRSAVTGY